MIGEYLIKKALYPDSDFALEQQRVDPNTLPLNPILRWIESHRNQDVRMQPRQA